MKTLLIIDIQYDFCPGGALAVEQGDAVIPVIRHIAPQFDLILATQDWHPAHHKSFAANNGKKVGEVINLNGQSQVMWPDHCVQGTHGAALRAELSDLPIAHIFQKGQRPEVDSYSGFFDNDHHTSTGLDHYLAKRGITKLYMCGLATDYCVKFTALDARRLGIDVYMIEDACRGVNLQPDDSAKAVAEMRQAGVHVVQSTDL